MKKYLRLLCGFVVGTIGYAVGFGVVGFLFQLVNSVSIIPWTIDLNGANLTASALGANFLSLWLFESIDKSSYHYVAFSIWLIVIAALYLVACLISSDYHLLWYPILSFIINGLSIKEAIKGITRGGE